MNTHVPLILVDYIFNYFRSYSKCGTDDSNDGYYDDNVDDDDMNNNMNNNNNNNISNINET